MKHSGKNTYRIKKILTFLFFLTISFHSFAGIEDIADSVVVHDTINIFKDHKSGMVLKMLDFSNNIHLQNKEEKSDIYVKYLIHTDNRNVIMKLIPSLYVISKERPDYIKEYYGTALFNDAATKEIIPIVTEGTIPLKAEALLPVIELYTPAIYSKTIFKNSILSPFYKKNRKFYRYHIAETSDSIVRIIFKPRVNNAQFVKGDALLDKDSGKIIKAGFSGLFDLMDFNIAMDMNDSIPVLPDNSELDVSFKFLGNSLSAKSLSVFSPSLNLTDSTRTGYSMDNLRPLPLTLQEEAIYQQYDSLEKAKILNKKDTTENKLYKKAWNTVQKTLVNSLQTDMGDSFSLKFSPLLNPSYLNYSHRKGISYRYDIRGKYNISDSSNVFFKIKLGYMFNKKQFYFDAPITYTFDAARNGTVNITLGNGNRITNSSVREQLIQMNPDSVQFKDMDLKYYTDNYFRLASTYDISPWLSTEICASYHRRSPVDKKEFIEAGQPTSYSTFAPSIEFTFKPFKEKGPVFTIDYERGVKGLFKSGIEYEKLEGDISWLKKFDMVNSISLRIGGGAYLNKSRDIYFLDYSNFKENNLPGGWNDNWSGDFQLLNPAWYNVSKFYFRTNTTFESPLLISYLIPVFGKFIECERFYMNTLITDNIHPYIEYGYAFKNRYFSFGVYMSTRNWHYESVGCRFSVEIFSRWK